jgi:hypothetical protein
MGEKIIRSLLIPGKLFFLSGKSNFTLRLLLAEAVMQMLKA